MIKFSIDTGLTLPLSKILPFQHDMKVLTNENYIRLRREIEETGFSFAVHIWFNPLDQNYYCLDGHQRVECMKRIASEELNDDIEIPVVLVHAENWLEAKRKCLSAASQYGQFNTEGLAKMIEEVKMTNLEADTHFHFPEINIMGLGKIMESNEDPNDPNAEYVGMPEFENEDLRPHRQLIVSFKNDEDVIAFAKIIEQTLTEKTRSIWFPKQENESMVDKRY